jgi:Domain of unknown function (DUF4136)
MNTKTVDRKHERPFALRWLPAMAAAAAASLLLAACTSIRVSSDYDHRASFSNYHTYAWLPREHARSQNPLATRHAQEAIDAEMQKKGYSLTSDLGGADFVVDFTLSAKERLDVQSYPVAYRGPWLWGRGYYGDQIDLRTYREGSLVIDIFDGRTHQPVWTGKATKELSQAELEHTRAPVQAATTAVLSAFPPL